MKHPYLGGIVSAFQQVQPRWTALHNRSSMDPVRQCKGLPTVNFKWTFHAKINKLWPLLGKNEINQKR